MSRLAALIVLLVFCAGCSPDVVEVREAAENVERQGELSTCTRAAYAEALGHYQNAVAWSKERLSLGVCASQHGFQWEIADEASRAVMGCGDFRAVIRTSTWAAPLRTVLAPTLTLRSLTGELLVVKRSNWENWGGVETFFQRSLTFWARPQGAYGPPLRIDFAANGRATWGALVLNPTTGDITWRTTSATYTVSLITTNATGPRIVTVTRPGKTVKFSLGVENPLEYRAAPIFVLQPIGAGAPALFSLVTECEA